jgi:hypothetical protein
MILSRGPISWLGGLAVAGGLLLIIGIGLVGRLSADGDNAVTGSCPVSRSGADGLVGRLVVPSEREDGILVPPLRSGKHYDLVVSGTFSFNSQGDRSDGSNLLVDGARIADRKTGDSRYCSRVKASGKPMNLRLSDSNHRDNSGAITVHIYSVD